jgi:hypothetical protein
MKERFFVGYATLPSTDEGNNFAACVIDICSKTVITCGNYAELARQAAIQTAAVNEDAHKSITFEIPLDKTIDTLKLEEFSPSQRNTFLFHLNEVLKKDQRPLAA